MSSCKKTSFINEKAADIYIKILKRTSNRTKIPTGAYLCPQCWTWHLTSKDQHIIDQLKREIANLKEKNEKLKVRNEKLLENLRECNKLNPTLPAG